MADVAAALLRQVAPTLESASTAMLAAAMAMQSADVAPTASQIAVAARARAQATEVMARWNKTENHGSRRVEREAQGGRSARDRRSQVGEGVRRTLQSEVDMKKKGTRQHSGLLAQTARVADAAREQAAGPDAGTPPGPIGKPHSTSAKSGSERDNRDRR